MVAALLSVLAGLATSLVIVSLHALLAHPEQPDIAIRVGLAIALMFVATTAARVMLVRLSLRAVNQLIVRLSERVLGAPLKRLEELGPARVTALYTEDVDGLVGAVLQLPALLSSLSILLVCFTYLAFRSPALLVVLIAALLITVMSVRAVARAAHRRDVRAREFADATMEHVRQIAQGNKELKLSRARLARFLEHELRGTLRGLEQARASSSTLNGVAQATGSAQTFVAIVAIAIAGRLLEVDFATVATFGFVVLYLTGPVGMILAAIPPLSRFAVSRGNLEELGLSLDRQAEAPSAAPIPTPLRKIALSQITHVYHREDGTQFTLGPLSLEVEAGALTFIVGGNGSGKSTLVKVITGLYPPESGHVQVDDTRIGPENQASYRELFGVVFADFFLPNRLPVTPGLERYLQALQLEGRVTISDTGIDTTNLSSGQRKRLALLATLLDDRPVYVFDEWASDQDPQFKELYYRTFLPELKARGKAVVVVTHDDRYFDLADRMLRLEDGQLRDERRTLATPMRDCDALPRNVGSVD